MRVLRVIGVLWVIGALAWNLQHAQRFGLFDPDLLERGPEPHHLAIAASAVLMTVPGLILLALGFARPRRRGTRIFSHGRHGHQARRNEAELGRVRRARQDEAHRPEPTKKKPVTRAANRNRPDASAPARPDRARPEATVATTKPPRPARSVIER